MDPIVHRGRSITLHRHGSVVLEVRIGGQFVIRLARPAEVVIAEICATIDQIDAHPEIFRTMAPCWYAAADPRRAEAQRFHGVPLHSPIDAPIQPG